MKILFSSLILGISLSASAVVLTIEPTKDSASVSSSGPVCYGNCSRGSIEQKVTVFEDKERGVLCYITHGVMKGSVPVEANETNPAISCVKM